MKRIEDGRHIDSFFKSLSQLVKKRHTVYITGGSALILYGMGRPTEDIDFEISGHEEISETIVSLAKKKKIIVQFSADIDRWGMISLYNYRRRAKNYKKFGKIEIKTIDPLNIISSKISRFTDRDIEDAKLLIEQFDIKKDILEKHLDAVYKKSIPSIEKWQFKKRREYFIKKYSNELWG